MTAEEGVAESVTALSIGVGRAIHLDVEPGFDAKEVGEVRADGELSAELEAIDLSAAQAAPEERFGRGGAVAVPVDSSIFSVSRDRHRITKPYRCVMRGIESKQSAMICLMSPATVVPQRHRLRAIKEFVDAALVELGVAFDLM